MKKENGEIIVKVKFIKENIYQKFKKNMHKTNDYYNINEWKKIGE